MSITRPVLEAIFSFHQLIETIIYPNLDEILKMFSDRQNFDCPSSLCSMSIGTLGKIPTKPFNVNRPRKCGRKKNIPDYLKWILFCDGNHHIIPNFNISITNLSALLFASCGRIFYLRFVFLLEAPKRTHRVAHFFASFIFLICSSVRALHEII